MVSSTTTIPTLTVRFCVLLTCLWTEAFALSLGEWQRTTIRTGPTPDSVLLEIQPTTHYMVHRRYVVSSWIACCCWGLGGGCAAVAHAKAPPRLDSTVLATDTTILVGDDDPSTTAPSIRRRPYAPTVESLLPATQVRVQLNEALQFAKKMLLVSSNLNNKDDMLLLSWTKELRDMFDPLSSSTSPPALPRAIRWLQPSKEEDERFALLSSNTNTKLSGRRARAALNVYTANLRFSGDSYVLTASPALRKQLIRMDALPDIQTVVTADLDLRDLYRNDVQTAIEDARAELFFLDNTQQRQEPDYTEVVAVLTRAVASLSAWFDLIDPVDVRAAEGQLAAMLALERPVSESQIYKTG